MRNLKAFILLAFLYLSTASKSQDFILRSADKDVPIEFSLKTNPYSAEFFVTPNSEISLKSSIGDIFEYNPTEDTFRMPLDVKFGNDIQFFDKPNDIYYMDTLQWKLYHLDDFEEKLGGWSEDTTSTCGNNPNRFLGGRCYFGNQTIEKTFKDLPEHSMIKVKLNYHFFGQWTGQVAYAKADYNVVWTHSYNWCDKVLVWMCKKYGVYACGGEFPDILAHPVEFTIQHHSSELTLSFSSTLDIDPCTASWGLDDIQVYIQ